MSKYTTELRFICEVESGLPESKGYMSVNDIVRNAAPKIFNFVFPLFDESYRLTLETKILKHYYTCEICEETYGLWKLRLDTRLNEIMPTFNKLYLACAMEFNPLYTHNLTHSHTGSGTKVDNSNGSTTCSSTSNATSVTNGKANSNSTNKYSDTPQGSLSGIESDTYLTNVTIDENETDSNGSVVSNGDTNTNSVSTNSTTGSTTDEYVDVTTGYDGALSVELIRRYKDALINIDMEVINALEDLFMQIW